MGSTFKKDGPFSKTFTFLRKRMYCTHHVDPLREKNWNGKGKRERYWPRLAAFFAFFSMILYFPTFRFVLTWNGFVYNTGWWYHKKESREYQSINPTLTSLRYAKVTACQHTFTSILFLIRKSNSYYYHSNPSSYENLTIVKTLCPCHRAKNREVVMYTEFYLQPFIKPHCANPRTCQTSSIRKNVKRAKILSRKWTLSRRKQTFLLNDRPTYYGRINRCLI